MTSFVNPSLDHEKLNLTNSLKETGLTLPEVNQGDDSQDNLHLTFGRISVVCYISHEFVTRIFQYFYPIASCDRCHA